MKEATEKQPEPEKGMASEKKQLTNEKPERRLKGNEKEENTTKVEEGKKVTKKVTEPQI